MEGAQYRLRWRFDYHRKAPICGMWSIPGDKAIDQAWNKSTEGLSFASIEGKDANNQIVLLAQEVGPKFCLFKWMAMAKFNGIALAHQVVGLQMVTSTKDVFVLDTGRVEVRNRSAEDLNYNYAAYGR